MMIKINIPNKKNPYRSIMQMICDSTESNEWLKYMSGVYCADVSEDHVKMVSTNGKVMAVADIPKIFFSDLPEVGKIYPIIKQPGFFILDDPIDEKFADWNKVIPKKTVSLFSRFTLIKGRSVRNNLSSFYRLVYKYFYVNKRYLEYLPTEKEMECHRVDKANYIESVIVFKGNGWQFYIMPMNDDSLRKYEV